MPETNTFENPSPKQLDCIPYRPGAASASAIVLRSAWESGLDIDTSDFERELVSAKPARRRWLVATALAGAASSLLLLIAPGPATTPEIVADKVVAPRRSRVVRLPPVVLADLTSAVEVAAPAEPPLAPLPLEAATPPASMPAATAQAEPVEHGRARAMSRRASRPVARTKTSLPAPEVTAARASSKAFHRQMRAGARAFKRGDFEKALKHYARAARLDATSADANFGVALAAVELHRDDLGYRAVFRTLRLDPDHALGNLLSGYLMQTYEDPEGAIAAYARYLDVEPEGRFALEVRALLKAMSAPMYAHR